MEISLKKGNVVLGFSVISVYLMAIPYCDKARAASGKCVELSSYVASEITSLVPHAPSSFPSFAVHSVSDGKLGGSLGTRLLIQYSMWIWILLAYDHS